MSLARAAADATVRRVIGIN